MKYLILIWILWIISVVIRIFNYKRKKNLIMRWMGGNKL